MNTAAARTSSLPMAADFTNFLSLEGKARKKSPLKGLLRFMKGDMISLGGGLPHPSSFPFYSLSAEVKDVSESASQLGKAQGHHESQTVTVPGPPTVGKAENLHSALQYGLGTGIPSLRNFCKAHIQSMHAPQYQDWDLILSAGNTDAFAKAASMICNRGDTMLVEEWTYPAALEMIEPLGIQHVPVSMDGEGMCPVALRDTMVNWEVNHKGLLRPKMVYLIPTGQNPTGATMGLQRRKDILDVCKEQNLIIVEDDPYYYLQFFVEGREEETGGWAPSLLSLDTDGRVIRLDTFSKTLAPGARVGYISCQKRFAEILQYHSEVTIQQSSGFSQALLSEMLVSQWGQEGYTRYLTRTVRAEYHRRCQFLQTSLKQHMNQKLASFIDPTAGMFIWIKIHLDQHPRYGKESDSALMLGLFRECVKNNVLFVPGWQFSSKPKPQGVDLADLENVWSDEDATYLRATFAYATFEEMEQASVRFGQSLDSYFAK